MSEDYKYIPTNDIKCGNSLTNPSYIYNNKCYYFSDNTSPSLTVGCYYKEDITIADESPSLSSTCYIRCEDGFQRDDKNMICKKISKKKIGLLSYLINIFK